MAINQARCCERFKGFVSSDIKTLFNVYVTFINSINNYSRVNVCIMH